MSCLHECMCRSVNTVGNNLDIHKCIYVLFVIKFYIKIEDLSCLLSDREELCAAELVANKFIRNSCKSINNKATIKICANNLLLQFLFLCLAYFNK